LAVRTLDTNVVVRLLIGDDPQQTPIAEQAFVAAIASCWSDWCAPVAWWWMTSTR
jgi:hypothetical protein